MARTADTVWLDRGVGTALLVFSPLLCLNTFGLNRRPKSDALCRNRAGTPAKTRRRTHPQKRHTLAARRERLIEVIARLPNGNGRYGSA